MDTTLTSDPRTLGYMLLATRLGFGLLFAVRGLQTIAEAVKSAYQTMVSLDT